jgi:cytidyltransferase-like protein
MGKIVSLRYLSKKKLRRPVVLTGGGFDLLHIGHAEFLKLCKSYGNTLVVLISSDKRRRERKGKHRPIVGEKNRAKLVSYLQFVDYAFISGIRCEDEKILGEIKPDTLVLSDEDKEEKQEYLKKHNSKEGLAKIRIKFVPAKFYSVEISTTNLINTILSNNS